MINKLKYAKQIQQKVSNLQNNHLSAAQPSEKQVGDVQIF